VILDVVDTLRACRVRRIAIGRSAEVGEAECVDDLARGVEPCRLQIGVELCRRPAGWPAVPLLHKVSDLMCRQRLPDPKQPLALWHTVGFELDAVAPGRPVTCDRDTLPIVTVSVTASAQPGLAAVSEQLHPEFDGRMLSSAAAVGLEPGGVGVGNALDLPNPFSLRQLLPKPAQLLAEQVVRVDALDEQPVVVRDWPEALKQRADPCDRIR